MSCVLVAWWLVVELLGYLQSVLAGEVLLPSLLQRWMSSWFQQGGIEAGPRDDQRQRSGDYWAELVCMSICKLLAIVERGIVFCSWPL